MTEFFGQSLHIDFYNVEEYWCDDLNAGYKLLDDLVSHLKMTKQAPPFIFHSPKDQFPEKQGLTGFVGLIESGISIHTLTLKRFVTIDIYTCGPLEIGSTIEYLCNVLKTKEYECHHLLRGLKYNKIP